MIITNLYAPFVPLLPTHPPCHPPFPLFVSPLPFPHSLHHGSTRKYAHACNAPPLLLKITPHPSLFSFHSVPHTFPACLPPSFPPHTHHLPLSNSATRRRRGSSGRPGMISLRLKGRMRKTGGMKGWRKKTTTTLSSAGCARMEGSCCAVTPAPPPTTSTASTLLSLKSLMENGSAPAAR